MLQEQREGFVPAMQDEGTSDVLQCLVESEFVNGKQACSSLDKASALRFHTRMKAERKTSLSGILNGLDINRHIGFPSLGATGRKSPHHHCSEITSMAASLQHNILLNTPPTDTSCR